MNRGMAFYQVSNNRTRQLRMTSPEVRLRVGKRTQTRAVGKAGQLDADVYQTKGGKKYIIYEGRKIFLDTRDTKANIDKDQWKEYLQWRETIGGIDDTKYKLQSKSPQLRLEGSKLMLRYLEKSKGYQDRNPYFTKLRGSLETQIKNLEKTLFRMAMGQTEQRKTQVVSRSDGLKQIELKKKQKAENARKVVDDDLYYDTNNDFARDETMLDRKIRVVGAQSEDTRPKLRNAQIKTGSGDS